ncbi:MAG TPA: acyl-CoA dehydrogenase family protein [Actinomycetota bacterium]
MSSLMDPFLQDPPRAPNRFRGDPTLRRSLERVLEPGAFEEATKALDEAGELATTEWPAMARVAESNPPRLVPFDAWGRRVDRIDVDPAWTALVAEGQRIGLTAVPYEDAFGNGARVVHAALLSLFGPVSATADCPLAMTDAAVRVLIDTPGAPGQYAPRLTARIDGWTSGQWMTEKEGGSDVGRTGTVARAEPDGSWILRGTKWFTSATTADMALALARAEGAPAGSRGLSLFLLELRRPDGGWNGITVRRLKDKMGTKALPTAELDLDGTVATMIGEPGRGVPTIAPMLNVTRMHAAFASLGGIGHGLALARDYASKREAFGRPLRELPVHRAWMARIAAEYEALSALSFRAAELAGAVERGGGDPALTRVVVPLTKMAVSRRAVWATSNLIESFGGAGYVEDTGLPRLLRDTHVNCIWEGTTSVMALDVLRALGAAGAAGAFLDDVEARARSTGHPALTEPSRAVLAARDELAALLAEPVEQNARRIAWGMARTYQAALLCEAAGWALGRGERAPAIAARMMTAEPLVEGPLPADDDLGALAFGDGS